MKRTGFTLAEVLITLLIIGIIAAVTLPALKSNIDKQSLQTQVSKMYSQLEAGLKQYRVDEGVSNNAFMDVSKFAKNYLEVAYVCKDIEDSQCFASEYSSIVGGNTKTIDHFDYYGKAYGKEAGAFVLKDGSVVEIHTNGIVFDVNGKKGPNKIGYDFHLLALNFDSNPIGYSNSYVFSDDFEEYSEDQFKYCKSGDIAYGCLMHLLVNGFKFDY